MWQFDTRFNNIITRTTDVKSFWLDTAGKDTDFKSGQFIQLEIVVNGEPVGHVFSISSTPLDKGYLEFTKRITASEYSKALEKINLGDWARVRGPGGRFTMPESRQPLAFLSGGIGITPIRSMLRYLYQTQDDWDIVILYGNRDEQDVVFKDELDEIGKRLSGVRVEHVLSQASTAWAGRRGLIDSAAIKELIPNYSQRLFYISGPPGMVTSLTNQLKALGVMDSQITRDLFTGYD